jgi:hypothetical protein
MGVSFTHPDYDRTAPKWKRCRDAVCGQDALHAAGEAYLPKLKAEDGEDYKARKLRSDFFNASWRTIAGLTGMAFRKPPVVDLPKSIEPFLNDIDLAGRSMASFAEMMVEEVLEVSRCGIMVDYPQLPENVSAISLAAAEQMGMRPSLKFYPAESIRNWRYSTVGNRKVLVMVVLGEVGEIRNGEFEVKHEERFRVLDLDEAGSYRQRVFAVREGKDILLEVIYPLKRGKPMLELPFAILGASGKGSDIDDPSLIDLIDANIAHYQVNSDYRHGLHFTGLPTLFLAGVVQEEGAGPFYIGGQAAITSNHPDAKAMFVEYTGQGLGAVERALAGLERRMAVLGARMIADESRQAETLGATQIKRQGENSILSRIVIAVSNACEWALGIMAEWVGASGAIKYEINREFTPIMMDAQQLTAMVGAWQAGGLSGSELFDVLQRGDIIDGEKSFEEHQEEIDANPQMPAPVVPAIAA